MNKINSFMPHVIKEISNAAAVISAHYDILHCNQAFEELFHYNADTGGRCEALHNLVLKLHENQVESPQSVTISSRKKPVFVHVYLLNNYDLKKNAYLLLVKSEAKTSTPQHHPLNPYVNEENFQSEKLEPEFNALIGENIKFRNALVIAQRAAKADFSVLIIGESGTGKEILARAIHQTSNRKEKQMVDVNCAAIPDSLIESELFGYEKGAFTGARTEGRKGYFDEAHEGTILLDEIGDASLHVQSKLLRVLESGTFKRVGGSRNVKADVRIISATNKDLMKSITEKTFREDLFYRLNTFSIQLPPLRDRARDIPLLVEHFLSSNVIREYRHRKFLPSCMDILCAYHWPGNVRELKGVVNYAVNMSSGATIDPSALPSFLFSQATQSESAMPDAAFSIPRQGAHLGEILQYVERDLIKEALAKSANRTAAIKRLGISRRTFYIKIKQYGLA
jgi:transcriptional regulator with PAS, ATPase and Fis domain